MNKDDNTRYHKPYEDLTFTDDFMFRCGKNASSELTKDIESNILQAKERGIWRREYMTLEDSLKVERKQWLKEGRAEAKLDDVDKLVESGLADEAKACEVLGVSLEDYKKYKSN